MKGTRPKTTKTDHDFGRPYPRLAGSRLSGLTERFGNATVPYERLHELAGDHGLVECRASGRRLVFVCDPVLADEVCLRHHERFRRGWLLGRVLENPTIVTCDGDDLLRRRRLYQPALGRKAREGCHPDIVAEIDATRSGLRDGDVVDLNRASRALMLNIAGRTLIGEDAGVGADLAKEFVEAMAWRARVARRPAWRFLAALPLPGNVRYRRVAGRLEGRIRELVRRARQDGPQRPGLVAWLANAADGEGVHARFAEDELRDELYALLFVSHDCSASALARSLCRLGRSPEARERLEREVDEVLGGRPPEPGDLGRLGFARAVLDETLRLAPPAACLGRQATEDVVVKGYLIPKGAVVHLAIRVPRQGERRLRDAERFVPERWLGDPQRDRSRDACVPFGGGPWPCSGIAPGADEVVASLAMLAQRWRLDPVSDASREVEDVAASMARGSLPVRVSARRTGR